MPSSKSKSSSASNREYYDAFASSYDHGRDRGYHRLIDQQASALVRRFAEGRSVLEVGCGTGLILQQVAKFAKEARGVDLSPNMLEQACSRGLQVAQADCRELPFPAAHFDVVYSFKVLAHVREYKKALDEMTRVLKPGGKMIIDSYNRNSLRYLIKKSFGPRKTSVAFDEQAILTRFVTPQEMKAELPHELRILGRAGIRIFTLHPMMLRVPGLAAFVESLEWHFMDSAMADFAGFYVLFLERSP